MLLLLHKPLKASEHSELRPNTSSLVVFNGTISFLVKNFYMNKCRQISDKREVESFVEASVSIYPQ